jgi:two-component system, sensor histidine kinase ChiS
MACMESRGPEKPLPELAGVRYCRRMVVLPGLLLCVLHSRTLDGDPAAGETLRFDHLTITNGLSQNTVIDIAQDRYGYVWLATEDGLNRFDGYEFKVFKNVPDDPRSISDNWILCLLVDREGTLWVGTANGGLNRYDAATETFRSFRHSPTDAGSLGADKVNGLCEDADGKIWAATWGGGLSCLDRKTGRFRNYTRDNTGPDGLRVDQLYVVSVDRKGVVWVGGNGYGLTSYDQASGRWRRYSEDPATSESISDNSVMCVWEDRENALWVGTANGGLNRMDRTTGKFTRFMHDEAASGTIGSNYVTRVLEDSRGNLWAATGSGGLNCLDRRTGKFVTYLHETYEPNSLSGNTLWCVFEDQAGVLWAGTEGYGASVYSRDKWKFTHYGRRPDDPDSLSSNAVWAMCEDTSGSVWVGTSLGLNLIDRVTGRVHQYLTQSTVPETLASRFIWALCTGRDGSLWVGTSRGLIRRDAATGAFQVYTGDPATSDVLDGVRVRALVEDSAGQVCIGTNTDGVIRLDPKTGHVRQFDNDASNPLSLSSGNVRSLYVDRRGKLWVGTTDGLNKLDTSTGICTRYLHDTGNPASISNDRIRGIYEDRTGNLWIGTNGGGLNRFDRSTGKFSVFLEKDGLPNNTVYGILEDDAGNLWLSTNRGISRYSPATGKFRNYDSGDGLQSDEFNVGASYRSSTGEMYFGGISGFNVFDPAQVRDNPHAPPVVLTSFKVFGKEAKLPEPPAMVREINLSWQDRFVSFEFAALDFSAPEKNAYACRLVGFDRDWIPCGQRRYINYTNLASGTYTLQVKAANNDGLWNENGLSIRLYNPPPPWRTWYAYLGYVLAGGLLIFGYVHLKTREHAREIARQRRLVEELRKIDQMKDEFLANTSHELRTPLNGIIGLAEAMVDGATGQLPGPATANLSMITSSGKRLLSLINDILDYSRLRHRDVVLSPVPLDLRVAVDSVFAFTRPLAATKGIELINDVPETAPLAEADGNRVQQILFNLVGNAIKFTESGHVRATAAERDGMLEICIEDTGTGVPPEKCEVIFESFEQVDATPAREHGGTGLGLSITKNLVELHGGRIRVESAAGKGSKFLFTLPMSREEARVRPSRPADVLNPEVVVPGGALPAHDASVPAVASGEGVAVADVLAQGESLSSILGPDDLGQVSVLVVDDEPVNLQVLFSQLSLRRYTVTTATSGADALKALESGQGFDLVILDIMMPRMSGYEVCRKIRERYTLFETPVLLLTARSQPLDIIQGFEAGANDYVVKPFDKNELLARVKTMVTLKRAVGQALSTAEKLVSEQRDHMLSETLRSVGKTLNSSLDLTEVLEQLLRGLRSIISYESAAVLLRCDQALQIVASAGFRVDEESRRDIQILPGSIFDELARVLRSCMFEDVRDDSRFADLARRTQGPVRAWVIAPLLCKGTMVGVLAVASEQAGVYDDRDLSLANTFAEQAAIAIENARLFGEVKRLSTHDTLTGVCARRHFFELADREHQRAKRYGAGLVVMMADIDNFKQINDTHGHICGDEVLKVVASRLLKCVRATDVIGRYGGEEFAIVLSDLRSDEVEELARRIVTTISDEHVLTAEAGPLHMTISLGVAAMRAPDASLASLIGRADTAMYVAKRNGKNRYELG